MQNELNWFYFRNKILSRYTFPLPTNFNWKTLLRATGENALSGISILFHPDPVGTDREYGVSTGPGLMRNT